MKKTRLISSLSALCMALAVLAIGVFAATSVSYNLNSTVSFVADGVYLHAVGNIFKGPQGGALSKDTSQTRYSYEDTSYTTKPGSLEPAGSTSTGALDPWDAGDVSFDSQNNVIEFRVVFTNYSEFEIAIAIENGTVVDEGVAMEEDKTGLDGIGSKRSATYVLRLVLEDQAQTVNMDIDVDVEAKSTNAPPPEVIPENAVDLIMFMGQSNMAGRGVAAEAPVVPEGHGYEFRSVTDPTKLYPIVEPFGVNENRGELSETIKTGSLVSAFAEKYYQETGVPIVGVSAAQGGKSVNWWQTGGNPLKETIARLNAAQDYLNNSEFVIRHQYMVWLQGESDGSQGMAGSEYKAKLTELYNQMHAEGIEKTMIIRIGDRQTNEQLHDGIIRAQTELCAHSDDFVLISVKLASIPLNEMKDSAHFKQYQYNEVGEEAATNMAYYVKTGKEPSFYDAELDINYPDVPDAPEPDSVNSFRLDVSNPNGDYDLTTLGTVSNGKLRIAAGTNTKGQYLEIDEAVVLSYQYSWTYEVVAGNFNTATGAGMIANTGEAGKGFVTIPPKTKAEAPATSAQFRFRDAANTFQIDAAVPESYDPTKIHHFALTYNADTKVFKAYIDKVECVVNYETTSTNSYQGKYFADTQLKNFLGGYPSAATSNFAGDFCYFAFTKGILETEEMYDYVVQESPVPDKFVLNVSDNTTYDLSSLGTVGYDSVFIEKGSIAKKLVLNENIILSDDYSWTIEFQAGGFVGGEAGTGMIANSGTNGSGFVTIPSRTATEGYTGSQFRFRDEGNTFQLDVTIPTDYDPYLVHYFALVYNATTKTFTAYIDKLECEVVIKTGSEASFNNTQLRNLLGGYPSVDSSNFAGAFQYFAFTKSALSVSEMYTQPK